MAWDLLRQESVTSTQDVAKREARAGLVVQALSQSGGRGRHGREWTSPPGNLYLSLVIQPNRPKHEIWHYAFITSLALYHAIDAPTELMLKWPNDVLYEGRKCAGILIEEHQGLLVIGLGVNITSAPEGAICVPDQTPDALRDRFLEAFAALQDAPFEDVRADWLSHAHPIGAPLTIKPQGEILEGAFDGLDKHGELRIKFHDGTVRAFSSADVFVGGANNVTRD